jgi:enoyl-CoA hydratase/carnithine racemase
MHFLVFHLLTQRELNQVLADFDKNEEIGAIVLTGSDRAFAGV